MEEHRDACWRREATRLVETAGQAERFVEQVGFASCLTDSRRPGPSLYVADGKTGAVSLKPVTVKAYETKDVIITGGVEEGASVVVLGVQKLDPAQKVRIVSSLSF